MAKEDLNRAEVFPSRKVLVVGNGPVSAAAVNELLRMGYEVIWTSQNERVPGPLQSGEGFQNERLITHDSGSESATGQAVEFLGPGGIVEFDGFPGSFTVRFRKEGEGILEREVGAVILAADPMIREPLKAWGLEAFKGLVPLSGMENNRSLKIDAPATFVYICGFRHSSYPFSQKKAVESAVKVLEGAGNRVIFIADHLKVADPGVERLTRQARDSGVLFVKLTGTEPHIEHSEEGLTVSCFDDALGDTVTVRPDLIVIEDEYRPPKGTRRLAEIMGLHLGPNGFFQGDNVYNLPIFTNRTGVWVVGSAKGPVSPEEGLEEAKAAVLEVSNLLGDAAGKVIESPVQLDRKKCAICLTCYRLCPHRAISYLNRRPVFSGLACRTCGICASECPMDAIQIQNFSDGDLKSRIQDDAPSPGEEGEAEKFRILAFVCENSAFEASILASLKGLSLPPGLRLLKVPCCGKVDEDYLLSAFRAGMDGVMVLACHHESCKSVNGSQMAEWRVASAREAIEEAGLERERLFFGTLGPGMAADLVRMAGEMEESLLALDRGHDTPSAGERRSSG